MRDLLDLVTLPGPADVLVVGDAPDVSPLSAAVDGMAVRIVSAPEGEGRLGQQPQSSEDAGGLDSAMIQRPQ